MIEHEPLISSAEQIRDNSDVPGHLLHANHPTLLPTTHTKGDSSQPAKPKGDSPQP